MPQFDRDTHLAQASRGAGKQPLLLSFVAGQFGGAKKLAAGFGDPACAKEKVGARCRQRRIVLESARLGDRVDQREAGLRAVRHAMGHGAAEVDNRRGRHFAQPIIEARDPLPVGVLGAWGPRMTGGDRGLERAKSIGTAEGLGPFERSEAAADQQLVPACTILLCDRNEGAVRCLARGEAGRLNLHQGEQAENFGLRRREAGEDASEPLRLRAQCGTRQFLARGRRIALIEDEINDLEHRGEPRRALGPARHLEGNAGVADRILGADDALRDRRFAREEGARDLLGGQAADEPERERRSPLAGKHRVTGREDQSEQLIADVIVHRGFQLLKAGIAFGVEAAGNLGMLAIEHPIAAHAVDGATLCCSHQPRTGIMGNTGRRPFGERADQRVLGKLLGPVDIARHPRKARDEPRPLDPEDRLDRPMDFGRRHTFRLRKRSAFGKAQRRPEEIEILSDP